MESESEKEPMNSLVQTYKITENPDGTYTLGSYRSSLTDQYSLSDLGIDENKLMANVSEVCGNMDLDGSTITEMKKLRKVIGTITFGDNKISDVRALEELAGHPVTWIKPKSAEP